MTMKLSLLSLLLWAVPVLAQVPQRVEDQKVYAGLTADLYSEVMSMDAVKESPAQRKQMIEQIKAALAQGTGQSLNFAPGLSWSNIWPPQKLNQDPVEFVAVNDINSRSHPGLQDVHSLKDPSGYISARLGTASSQMIKDGSVAPIVLGGFAPSISAFLNVPDAEVFKIASFYEVWGLEKYFVPGRLFADQKPRLVYVVPPIQQYLEHYQYMLHLLTGKDQTVVRIQADFNKWKRNMAEGSARLLSQWGTVDYVVTGYYKQWSKEQIGSDFGFQVLKETETIKDPAGHFAKKITVFDREQKTEFSVVLIGHEKTIWGEATVAMIEGVLPSVRRGVVFMGSAGSVKPELKVYDLSVPGKFTRPGNQIPISNFLQLTRQDFGKVYFDGVHGNTASPAEQTKAYVQKHLSQGTTSFDVEQSLLAEAVGAYNLKNRITIQFGAVNVITDKPFGDADHDLDQIDEKLKGAARQKAVHIALRAMGLQRQQAMSCSRVHR